MIWHCNCEVNVSVAQIDSVLEVLRLARGKRDLGNRELGEIDRVIAELIDIKNCGEEKELKKWIALLPSVLRLLAECVPAIKDIFGSLM